MFEDNDRPGVMLAASARDFLHRYGVLAGREVVVFTSDDAAYAAAVDLHDAGATVQVIDARPTAPRALVHGAARSAVSPSRRTPTSTAPGDPTASPPPSSAPERREVPCDLLLTSGGWNPTAHLFSHVGGRLAYDPSLGAFRPAATPLRASR